jgi:predicted transcriptional regulator
VLEKGEVVGVLGRTRLLEALRDRGVNVPVGEVMESDFQMASADEELDAALGRIEPGRATLLPVILNRQLVGLLTTENVGEFYMIRRALSEGAGHRPPVPPVIRIPRVMPPPPPLPIRQPSS